MPNNGIKKLGNKRLDTKQPALDLWDPQSPEDHKLQSEYKAALRFRRLIELMEHFKIDPKDEYAWMYLSIKLADHCVPAMQFSKKIGQPKKWDFDNKLKLYALVEALKPHFSKRKELFNELPRIAQQTALKNIVSEKTKPITLQGHYDKFVSSKEGKEMIEIFLTHSFAERQEYFSDLVSNKDFFISK